MSKECAYPYAPRAMGVAEAARYCGISASTFKKLPVFKKRRPLSDGRWGWDKRDLDAHLDLIFDKAPNDAEISWDGV